MDNFYDTVFNSCAWKINPVYVIHFNLALKTCALMMTAEGRKSPVHVHVDRETPVHVHLKKKKKAKPGVPTAVEVRSLMEQVAFVFRT